MKKSNIRSVVKYCGIILLLLLLCGLSLAFFFRCANSELRKRGAELKHQHAEELSSALESVAPHMNYLAESGKPDAIIWMVKAQHQNGLKNYPSYDKQFEQLIKKDNTKALLLKAVLTYPINSRTSFQYAEKAKNEGNFDAYLFLQEKGYLNPKLEANSINRNDGA